MKDSPEKASKKIEEENDLDTSPTSEAKDSEEIPEPKTKSAEEVGGEGKETGESEKKKGYSQRVRQLNERTKQAEAKAQSLEERIAELTVPVEPRYQEYQQQPQSEPIVGPGEEIDGLELDKRLKVREHRILQQADTRAELKARQTESLNRIRNETSEVMRLNPELDPESKDFNPDLSEAITDAVEAGILAKPYTASPKAIVDKMMKPYKGAVTKEVGKVSENLAKQVSEAAVRPSSVSKAEKPFEEKSIEEMEKDLGVVCT